VPNNFGLIRVGSAEIENLSILNEDVNAGALIDRSKMNEAQDLLIKLGKSLKVFNFDNSEHLEIKKDAEFYKIITSVCGLSLSPSDGVVRIYNSGTKGFLMILDGTTSKYISFEHDSTDGKVVTNSGKLVLAPATNIDCNAKEIQNCSAFKYNSAKTGYISVHPSAFLVNADTSDYIIDEISIKLRVSLDAHYLYTPIIFDDGVTIKRLTFNYYNNDADASCSLSLKRLNFTTRTITNIQTVTGSYCGGWGGITEIELSHIINNELHCYFLELLLDPDASVDDVKSGGVRIKYETTEVKT